MNRKSIIIFSLLLFINFLLVLEANAGCPSRQLTKVCNTCKNQALNSPQCQGNSSSSSTSNCPTTSSCPYNQSFNRLKISYNISVKFSNANYSYKLKLITRPDDSGKFRYFVTYLDKGSGKDQLIADELIGFIYADSITFALPGAKFGGISNPIPEGILSCYAYFENSTSDNLIGGCNHLLEADARNETLLATTTFATVQVTPE